jgi:hypothetical protein
MNGEVVGTILPPKLVEDSTVIRFSLAPALTYLIGGLDYMISDGEMVWSIFALLVKEAMSYGDDYGDIGDAVEYAARHPNCQDKDSLYGLCADTSEKIYAVITRYIPDFGTKRFIGKYLYELQDNADVYIRISNTALQGGNSSSGLLSSI